MCLAEREPRLRTTVKEIPMSLASRRGTKASMCAPSRIENRGSRIVHASPRLASLRHAASRRWGRFDFLRESHAASFSRLSKSPDRRRSLWQGAARTDSRALRNPGRREDDSGGDRCGRRLLEEDSDDAPWGLFRNRVPSWLVGDVDVLKLVACESEADAYRILD